MPVLYEIAPFSKTPCRVGESPVWDAEQRRLLWADIMNGRIYAKDEAGGLETVWQVPAPMGSFGLAADGRLVVGLASGVHLFDPATGAMTSLVEIEEDAALCSERRLNDGKIGPDGAFWVGSMHKDGPTAALWRVTADGRADRKVGGLSTSNGLAFSADGRTLFHSDSRQCWIDRWDLDPETGEISGRTRIAEPGDADGRPDGGATDMEGRYWSAGVSAGRLNCYDRDGRLLESVVVPPKAPTMPCFGGVDMRTLYFTSLRRPETCGSDCGGVFMLRVEVPGVPVHRFATASPAGTVA
jgi:sugar lactone lactonase YvrE